MTPLDPDAARLIAANAPFWAAEVEVCRAYFRSPARTTATDLAWLARQAAKELVDGVEVRTDDPGVVAEERAHLAAFTAAYDALRPPGAPPLSPATLRDHASWPANDELRAMRSRHAEAHGELGLLAGRVTEGGGAALFRAGAELAGGGGADDVIATACAAVLADEERHALDAAAALAALDPGEEGWATAVECTTAQSRQRLLMRAEQFGRPVDDDRFAAMLSGTTDPSGILDALGIVPADR